MRRVTNRGNEGANALMERYSTGDGAAFGELYEVIGPQLLGFLRRAVPDGLVAEDLLQETLLQIHRARGSFTPGAPVMPWAFAIARRLMIDGARRRRTELAIFRDLRADDDRTAVDGRAGAACADDALHARRVLQCVQQRLESLPRAQRIAYHLVKQEGLSLRNAAQVLGTSVNAVKLRTHRVYEALRRVLREQGEVL
jgi:RNA polymerase sigma-70 factor, ECF subfamily